MIIETNKKNTFRLKIQVLLPNPLEIIHITVSICIHYKLTQVMIIWLSKKLHYNFSLMLSFHNYLKTNWFILYVQFIVITGIAKAIAVNFQCHYNLTLWRK